MTHMKVDIPKEDAVPFCDTEDTELTYIPARCDCPNCHDLLRFVGVPTGSHAVCQNLYSRYIAAALILRATQRYHSQN